MMNETIIPYNGFGDIDFSMSFDTVIKKLKENNVRYITEHWPNKGCSPEVAWDIIRIGNNISVFFAKNKMFKVYFENDFSGKLENGIRIGMAIKDALTIDPNLEYDEWEEEYISKSGYWLEDDPETNNIISITVFIKELEDDDEFFSYEWCK